MAGPTIQDRLDSVRAVAFDLDGTIYLQGTPLPGALELLNALRSADVNYIMVTNNSSVSSATYLAKLAALGIQPQRHQVLTSNDVAISHLQASGISRPYLLATREVREEYASVGLTHEEESPDAVLLTFDMELTFEKLAAVTRHINAGLPYLATHPDVTCPVKGGVLPDAGAFIELFAAATGRRPQILGKPHAGMIKEIHKRLGLPAERIAFVGDRLETDILMAANAGFVGVLTLTGVTPPEGASAGPVRPDVVVSGMEEFRALLRRVALVS